MSDAIIRNPNAPYQIVSIDLHVLDQLHQLAETLQIVLNDIYKRITDLEDLP